MYSVYHLNANDFNENFIKSVRTLFEGKKIEVCINEEYDETDFLMKNEVNRKRLLKSIKNIEDGKNLIQIDLEKFRKLIKYHERNNI